jgi:hypothetical protein
MRPATIAVGAVLALAAATAAFAQGKSQAHKKTSTPPSRSELSVPAAAVITGSSGGGTAPAAWLDDATILEPGSVSASISMLRWQGTDIHEVDVPVVDAAFGLADRVHVAVSVPRVIGSADPAGAAGGLGTSSFTAKIGLLDGRSHGLKLAAGPTLQVLSPGVVEALGPGQDRVQFGLPVSAEIGRGAVRVYASTGFFSSGVWFAGGGAGVRTSDRLLVSAGISRAWHRTDLQDEPLANRARNELSGAAAYAVRPNVSVFGSVGKTLATLEENGAGTTIGGGVSFYVAPAHK